MRDGLWILFMVAVVLIGLFGLGKLTVDCESKGGVLVRNAAGWYVCAQEVR